MFALVLCEQTPNVQLSVYQHLLRVILLPGFLPVSFTHHDFPFRFHEENPFRAPLQQPARKLNAKIEINLGFKVYPHQAKAKAEKQTKFFYRFWTHWSENKSDFYTNQCIPSKRHRFRFLLRVWFRSVWVVDPYIDDSTQDPTYNDFALTKNTWHWWETHSGWR